ncbi:MAG: DNA-processing protein DprA [Parvibaculales bacterium]
MTKYSPEQKRDMLRLIRTDNVGPVTFHKLLEVFKDPSEALKHLPDIALRGGRKSKLKIMSIAAAEKELAANEKLGARILVHGEPDYPRELAAIPDAPPVISALGHIHLLRLPKIGFVGSRNASMNALKMTEKLSAGLADKGFGIVSGMARGVDAAAHWQGLHNGTIAVLAGGVDIVYPKENQDLYQRIKDEGLIIAENPPGTKPLAQHFPRRNRLISGLCLGVVVTEAAQRSGSLITARLAGEQGREILAVPGSPLDPRCRGSNNLIRQGATLVEDVDDILDVVRPLSEHIEEPERPDKIHVSIDTQTSDAARNQIIELLGPSPVTIDELIAQTHYPPSVVHMVIIELELAGRLIRDQIGVSLNMDT